MIGMAMAVASTVVLMRVLIDADALTSPAGHVAVGWLLVEDILTVIVLVIIPVLSKGESPAAESGFWSSPLAAVGIALLKLAALVAIVVFAGLRVVPWVLTQVARLRSRELFTLTVMVFSIGSARRKRSRLSAYCPAASMRMWKWAWPCFCLSCSNAACSRW